IRLRIRTNQGENRPRKWVASARSRFGVFASWPWLVARIIRRVEVLDGPWPDAMELQHRFTLRPDKVLHAGRPVAVTAGGHGFGRFFIELVTHADVKGAGNDGDALGFGVCVRRNPVAVGHLDSKHERPFFGWIALEHCYHRPLRQRG